MAQVLVIDDEEAIRRLIRRTLEQQGHVVTEAADGRAALDQLAAATPDLVVADIYMPDMDGIEFAIRMSQLPSPPRLIAISGGGHRSADDVLSTARRLGAAVTLAKPFTPEELRDAVAQALGEKPA